MLNAALVSASAAVLQLDNVQAGQFLFARPAFAGPLLGWLAGCPLEGAKIGLLTELVFMDFMSVGGVVPPNGLAASAVGVLAFSWADLPESAAFFCGMLAGWLYRKVEYRLRVSRSALTSSVEAEVRLGVMRIGRRIAGALLIEFFVSGAFVFVLSGCAALASGLLFQPVSGALFGASDLAYSMMPWLGLSGLYFRFRGQIYKKAAGL